MLIVRDGVFPDPSASASAADAYSRAFDRMMFRCLSTHRSRPTNARPSRTTHRVSAPMTSRIATPRIPPADVLERARDATRRDATRRDEGGTVGTIGTVGTTRTRDVYRVHTPHCTHTHLQKDPSHHTFFSKKSYVSSTVKKIVYRHHQDSNQGRRIQSPQ